MYPIVFHLESPNPPSKLHRSAKRHLSSAKFAKSAHPVVGQLLGQTLKVDGITIKLSCNTLKAAYGEVRANMRMDFIRKERSVYACLDD